uniref:ribosomal protein S15 n=1 Tax=Schizaea poeppigiana TaxID=148578 RepID=UPI00211476D1|nr:ribosomal protein S15 [Schizaea poeppigiana]YP_010444924.1 ribosomal protein S15 [Schizaea poeppigiana]UTJ90427.1 ribosomal protein S15 [Schizaea poeppigiana]UTJ90428.1 ribosomal protein S15 [Schizaea poeppigiana]
MNKGVYTNPSQVLEEKEKMGSTQSQISQISLRVLKITYHLKFHPRDYSSQRGLWKPLGRRKSIPNHLFKRNRDSYNRSVREPGIRGSKDYQSGFVKTF